MSRALWLILLAVGPARAGGPDFKKRLAGFDACFILRDVKTGRDLYRHGGERCAERNPACSTFKVPLALMAFDSEVLRDENETFKWDRKPNVIPSWNQDHTAATWMRDSVVWYSQRVSSILGLDLIRRYLADFQYGSQDMSGGVTSAWLTIAPFLKAKANPTLRLSADEQAAFLVRMWRGELKVSPRALELTRKITYLETSPKGWVLHGKTGSGFLGPQGDKRLGWFIAHLQKGEEEYASVVQIVDRGRKPEGAPPYAGLQAKEIMKALLSDAGKW